MNRIRPMDRIFNNSVCKLSSLIPRWIGFQKPLEPIERVGSILTSCRFNVELNPQMFAQIPLTSTCSHNDSKWGSGYSYTLRETNEELRCNKVRCLVYGCRDVDNSSADTDCWQKWRKQGDQLQVARRLGSVRLGKWSTWHRSYRRTLCPVHYSRSCYIWLCT